MSVYTFYQDPGHGWIDVSAEEVKRLGIAGQVSRYSYAHGDRVYLEEDCDAALFMDAKKGLGEPVQLVEVYQERTPIRHYEPYKGVK